MENKPVCEIDDCGNKRWYNEDGLLHREDGPAYEGCTGFKEWYINGKRHKEDGPSSVYPDGAQHWFKNGFRHRVDGPAIVNPNGRGHWYINDFYVTEKIIQWAEENDIDLDNLSDVDIALIKLTWADYGK